MRGESYVFYFQDAAGDDTTSSSQRQKSSADKKAKNKPNMINKKKSDKKSLASKTPAKSVGKGKVKKTALLKVSKKIFTSKPKKRALNTVRQSEEAESCNNSSSQNNKKADSKSVKNVNKPKKVWKDTSDKLNKTQCQPEGKIKKRKLDKKTLAKRKLSRMKKLGYLTAPPRRSAALNASAIMNCIFDKAVVPRPIKIKVEPEDSEEETEDDPSVCETVDSDSDQDDGSEKLTDSSQNKINDDSVTGKPSRLLSETTRTTRKERKGNLRKKSKQRKGEMSELSDELGDYTGGGRRMASLNASAMLHASFGREEKRSRRDPLTIAIEASLRDLQEKEKKEPKEEISEISSENVPLSSNATSDNIKSSQKNLISKTSHSKTDLKESIKAEAKESLSPEVVVKHEKKEKVKCLKSSLEGLSELDIRTQLIESAKIKSKISRQSSEDKMKKKLKKSQQDKAEEKYSGKSRPGKSNVLLCSLH